MTTGLNRVFRHAGKELHLQTEDLGREAAEFEMRVYDGGNVVWNRRVSYAKELEEGLPATDLDARLLALMNKTILTVEAAIAKGRIELPG